MLTRIGKIIYWALCGYAALAVCVVGVVIFRDDPVDIYALLPLIEGVSLWLIGRAALYALSAADQRWHRSRNGSEDVSTRTQSRPFELASIQTRLGTVIYWALSGLAVLCLFVFVSGQFLADHPRADEFLPLAIGILIWATGRAALYVLSAR